MLGNHDYGQLKPTKSEEKKKKKKEEEKKKRKEEKEEEEQEEKDELDSLPPPPRPSAAKCAAALGSRYNASSPSSSQQCSYGPLSQLDAGLSARDPRFRVLRQFYLRL